jgi:hypothetical protein
MYARIEQSLNAWFTRHGSKVLVSLYLLVAAGIAGFAAQVYGDWRETGNDMVGVVGGVAVAICAAVAILNIASSWED